ncbi:MAG: hypothetical protein JRJ85_12170, partial [Deltaproteobacteria bacterium]|nr:hypothetical protein [Deltaproteobacteria bacterium]
SISIGTSTLSSGTNSLALAGGNAGATRSISIGVNSETTGIDSISIGRSSKVTYASSVAIGYSADVSNQYGIALGFTTQVTGDSAISIGRNVKSSALYSILISTNNTLYENSLANSFEVASNGSRLLKSGLTMGTQILVDSDPTGSLTDAISGSLVYDSTDGAFKGYIGTTGWERMNYWVETSGSISPYDSDIDLELSSIEIESDIGSINLVDLLVTSGSVSGSEQSYTLAIDSNDVLKIYGISDGSGSLTEKALVIEADYQYMGNPITDGSWRFYVSQDADQDLVFEKRISGSWAESGRFE